MANKPKVYVTQETNHDFRAAAEFGDLVFLTDGRRDDFHNTKGPHNVDLIDRLQAALREYNEGDFVVLVGSPYVQAAVMWILGNLGFRIVRLLRWDNRDYVYSPLELRMF